MSLQDMPGLVLIALLLWMTSMTSAEWCAPTCDGVLESGTQVIDPSNCMRYYVCSGTEPDWQLSNPIECPPGYVFDRFLTTPQCAPEANIHIDIGEYCSGYCNPCQLYCVTSGQLIPDPTNNHQYYICLGDGNVLPTPEVCPGTDYFDYLAQECGPDEEKTFGFCDECEVYCVEAGDIPDPYDRCSYYSCDPPVKIPFSCPVDEYFNIATLTCEPSLPDYCPPAQC